MKITKAGTRWIVTSSYEERALPKAAGLRFHWARKAGNCKPGCAECKAGVPLGWWTDRPEIAARLAEHATGAEREELQAIAAGRKAAVEASRAAASTATIPAPEGLDYLPYQKAGITYALARPSTLIGDEMGLGKTIQALGVINADPSIRAVLVVCPATLRLNWKREAERWLTRPFAVRVLEGAPLPGLTGADLWIVNYDRLVGAKGKALREALLASSFDLLVVDEAHFLKNDKAQRTRAVLGAKGAKGDDGQPGLIARAARKLFLTGTPVLNRPIELFPLLSAIAPSEFNSFWHFAKRYCNAHQGGHGWDMSGASNLEELQERMRASCMVRRLKADVLTELPPKQRQVVEIDANGASGAVAAEERAWTAHEDRLAELRAEAELAHASGDAAAYESAVAALTQATRVAFTEISKVRHETALAKVPKVIEHVRGMLDEGVPKVILFAHHHDVIRAMADEFGAAAVTLTGETTMADRQVAVDRFQGDAACRVFIGSITAAGVGITLTAASNVVFAELDWVPANVTQAEDRCHRIGQHESVLIQHLVLDGSLDARMAKILVAKQTIADAALDRDIPEFRLPAIPTGKGDGDAREARERRPATYPVATAEQRAAALSAMRMLAGMCDGARAKDEAGFSAFNAKIGHELAQRESLTDGQVWLAARIATTHRRQLPDGLLEAIKGAPAAEPVEVK